MKLENLNDEIMVTCALRYCLGRQTYVVGACCEFIRQVWNQLPKNSKGVIVRDILEAFGDGNVGHNCDAYDWRSLVRWCYENSDKEVKEWLKRALVHKENALDALTYDEIGQTVYLKDENAEHKTSYKIIARSDARGLCYKLIGYKTLEKEWYKPEELEWS